MRRRIQQLILLPFSLLFCSVAALGQIGPGDPGNLFVSWNSAQAVSQFELTVPDSWSVREATVISESGSHTSLVVRQESDGAFRLSSSKPLSLGDQLIVGYTAGPNTGSMPWHVLPLGVDHSGALIPVSGREAGGMVPVLDVPGDAAQVAVFGGDRVRSQEWTASSEDESFTLEWWMKTTELDRILLSNWNGVEADDYSIELVINELGHLLWFSGSSGRHTSIATDGPIADGAWHHVAAVHDVGSGVRSLFVDGRMVSTGPATVQDAGVRMGIGGRSPDSPGGTGLAFSGALAELRFWRSARSEEEIQDTRELILRGQEGMLTKLDLGDSGALAEDLRGPAIWRSMSSLRSQVSESFVDITWRAARIGGTQEFLIERSEDAVTYEEVGRVAYDPLTEPDNRRAWTDVDVPDDAGVRYYRLTQIFENGLMQRSGVLKVGIGSTEYRVASLVGNSPNPFNPATTIAIEVAETALLELSVWDISGQRVKTLAAGRFEPGQYTYRFDAETLPSGIYFAHLTTEAGLQTLKMALTK